MDVAELLAPAATGALAAITETIPLGVPIFVGLVALTLTFTVFRKFGIKR